MSADKEKQVSKSNDKELDDLLDSEFCRLLFTLKKRQKKFILKWNYVMYTPLVSVCNSLALN